MSLLCRFLVPAGCLGHIFTDPDSMIITAPQFILRLCMPGFCCFPVPLYRLCRIFGCSGSFFQIQGIIVLPPGVPVFCCFLIPADCFRLVHRNAASVAVTVPHPVLGGGMPCFCGMPEQRKCFFHFPFFLAQERLLIPLFALFFKFFLLLFFSLFFVFFLLSLCFILFNLLQPVKSACMSQGCSTLKRSDSLILISEHTSPKEIIHPFVVKFFCQICL